MAAGWPSQFGSSESTKPQEGEDAVQIKFSGRPISGSSNAPTRTTIRFGRDSDSLNNGVPHLGQKRRRMTLPLSALLTYSLTSPVISKASVLNIALIDALPEDRYWQSLHQQARTATGLFSDWNRTTPQKHRPVTNVAILPRLHVFPRKLKRISAGAATLSRIGSLSV
ncbi:hypothetical protein L2A60_12220 [Acidiphilium iwatense]|uniref:Uncharacterized protein n=1 Tax=Acidiphilium iwatense TaxID=768198 RepID=A0ABS9DXM8_9PROT|nr:hypothetical protein [Acidiphilium iwatense]MCF3947443.1 hypothetical protein [Acidiphilium iwatense]